MKNNFFYSYFYFNFLKVLLFCRYANLFVQSFFDIFYRSATLTRQRRIYRRRRTQRAYEQCYVDICLAEKVWISKETVVTRREKNGNKEDSFLEMDELSNNLHSIFKKE